MRNLLGLTFALVAIAILSPAAGWAFWTFKPEDFLKDPVYSRDYPPCKHCQSPLSPAGGEGRVRGR